MLCTPQKIELKHSRSVKTLSVDSPQISRDLALDFIKGVLVVAMLAYHAGNLFILDPGTKSFVLGIVLDFVSGSWLFLCGLLISSSSRRKFAIDPMAVTFRFWIRATKILVLFFLLNAVIYRYSLIPRPTASLDLEIIGRILWYGGGELSSFEVLIGIAYLLLFAPLLLWLRSFGPVLIGFILAAGVISVLGGNRLSPNCWLVYCGLGGVLCGYLLNGSWLHKICETTQCRSIGVALALLGTAAYYTLIASYGYTRTDIHVYLLGIACIFFTLYLSHVWLWPNNILDRTLQLVGRYSLLSYIGQMALLWGLLSLGKPYLPASYWLILPIAACIMVVSIKMLDFLLHRSKPLRATYSAIFG